MTRRSGFAWASIAVSVPWMLQRFFVEQAGGDPVRRQPGIVAERLAGLEPAPFIESDRGRLKGAGFETQDRPVGGARLLLDTREQRLADAASADALAGV